MKKVWLDYDRDLVETEDDPNKDDEYGFGPYTEAYLFEPSAHDPIVRVNDGGKTVSFDYGNVGHTKDIPTGYTWRELILAAIALYEYVTTHAAEKAEIDALTLLLQDSVGWIGAGKASADGLSTLAAELHKRGVRAPNA